MPMWDVPRDITFVLKQWLAPHGTYSIPSTVALHFTCSEVLQWIFLLSQSPHLFSPKLQSCSHSASVPAQEITVTPLLPFIKCLAPSNSLGFNLCTVRSVNLPCCRFFSQEVPVCSETHLAQVFLPVNP